MGMEVSTLLYNKYYLTIFLTLLLVLGCNNSVDSQRDYTEQEVNNESGSIAISIPTISDLFYESMIKSGSSEDNRAFNFVDVVSYVIYSEGEVFKTGNFFSGDYTDTFTSIIEITPGTYTMSVDIYNLDNSSQEPTASGTSESFIIESGELTAVNIITKPNTYTTIDSSSTIKLTKSDFVTTNIFYDIDMGSEMWFKYTALYDNTELHFDYILDSYRSWFSFLIFDEDGLRVGSLSTYTDKSFNLIGSVGDVYYIGATYNSNPMDNYDDITDVTISSSQIVFEDNNNSFDTANSLTTDGSKIYGIVEGTHSDYYSISLSAGLFYEISSTINYPLQVRLYNSNYIEYIQSYELVKALSLSHNAVTFYCPEDDTFYLDISNYMAEDSNMYDLVISEVEPETISLSDEWQNLEVDFRRSRYYILPVTPGTEYTISWDDEYDGSGTYTGDVSVSVLSISGSSYFHRVDTAYDEPKTFTPELGTTEVYIQVYGYESGTFGMLVK